MKNYFLAVFTLFLLQGLMAQQAQTHSDVAYVYEVNPSHFKLYDASYLKKQIPAICKNTPVDTVAYANIHTFKSNFTRPGFFLLVYIEKYDIQFDLLGNFPWTAANVFTPMDGGIRITDSLHQPITNLDLMFEIEKMHYNPYHQVYIYSQLDQDGVLKISNGDITQEFYLNTNSPPYKGWNNNYYNNANTLTGFIATNQPKYKHGDTLKIKAYLCKENGKPYTRDVQLKISQSYNTALHSIWLKPVSPGAYVYNYVITDSLQLDQTYNVQLYTSPKKYAVLTNTFKLEDYELDEITYNFTPLHSTYYRDDSLYFQLEAYDKNYNTAFDAEVDIIATPYYIGNVYSHSVYFPETLYQANFKMQDLNQGIIQLPTSLKTQYPADYMLSIEATCRNSNNELKKINTTVQINQYPAPFQTYISNRYIHVSTQENMSDSVEVFRYTNFTAPISRYKMHKKDSVPIDPLSTGYLLKWDGQEKKIKIDASLLSVNVSGKVQVDTLFLTLQNPYQVPVQIYYYKNEKKHELKNTGSQWLVLKKNEQITVYYEYQAGEDKIISNRSFIINDKNIFIKSNLPDKVYPGQNTTLNISTTNYKNAPLENTNLTILSVNAAFTDNNVPMVPHFGTYLNNPAIYPKGNISARPLAAYSAVVDSAWVHYFGLENQLYYRSFISKQVINVYREPKTDKKVTGGLVKIVNQYGSGHFYDPAFVEENNQMVYYNLSPTNHIKTNQGEHTYRVRLSNRYVDLPPVTVYEDSITYIVIKSNYLPKLKRKKTTFDYWAEQVNLKDKFMLVHKNQYNNYPTFISNYKETYCLLDFTNGFYYLGPFTGNDSAYVEQFYSNQAGFVTNSLTKGKKNYLYKPDKITEDLSNYTLPVYEKLVDNPFIFSTGLDYYYQTYTQWQTKHVDALYGNFEAYPYNSYNYVEVFNNVKLLFPERAWKIAGTMLMNIGTQEVKKYRGCIKEFDNLQPGPYRVVYVDNQLQPLLEDSLYTPGKGILIQHVDTANRLNAQLKNQILGLGTMYEGIMLEKETLIPIPFSTITVLKNGQVLGGALTDIDGKFRIQVPPGDDIQVKFSCIGYASLVYSNDELAAKGIYLNIQMDVTELEMQEYVVQTVTITKIDNYTTNSSYQSIKLNPGVDGYYSNDLEENVNTGRADRDEKEITTLLGGVPAKYGDTMGGIYDLDKNKIVLGNNLDPEIILGANTIRSFFSDHAIWQPNLLTSANGNATCQVTFPENITSWDTYILAMHPKGLSGRVTTQTKSFKPVVASLYLPAFVIEGDSFEVVNKVMNYTSMGLDVKNKLQLGETTIYELDSNFKDFFIHKKILYAPSVDSLKISFSSSLTNGYMDGEKRIIPVYKKGIQAAVGEMFPVWKNGTIKIDSLQESAEVELEVYNGFDNLVTKEADYLLFHYMHGCNEQISSKLTAAIAAAAVTTQGWKKDIYELQIERMIHLLQKNQNDQGGWGWWNKSKTDVFMTLKVGEALKFAEENGYQVKLKKSLSQNIPILLESCNRRDDTLAVIKMAGLYNVAKETVFDFKTIYALTIPQNDYQKLMVMEIKQLYHQPIDLNELMGLKKQTLFGNYYWGTNSYSIYDNASYMTATALSILQRNHTSQDTLIKVLGYLLEKRVNNHFANTMVSAKLALFFHEYLGTQGKTPPLVIVNKKDTMTINNTYEKLMIPAQPTTLDIVTDRLIYVGYSQQQSVPFEAVKDDHFQITTQWLQDGKEVKSLTSGKFTTLHTQLVVKKDAQYMSFEIPIPAGCTYAEKPQSWYNYYEVHREYFKDRVVIYYENLPAGTYNIDIKMECRLKGHYAINNSLIENMYFPQLNGYNALQNLVIR
jgi:hypothetical protein